MPKGRGANQAKVAQQQSRHIRKIVRGAMDKWDEENPEEALLMRRMAARKRRIGEGASMKDDDKKDNEENPESPKPGPQEGPPQAEPPDDGAGSIPRDDA